MSDQENKRRFSRIPFEADILLSKKGDEWRTKLIDISLKGVLVQTPKNWDAVVGEKFHLEVIFNGSGSLITADTNVAHSEGNTTGFEMMSIDLESVAHLRRLVELNLGDPELLDRELHALHWK